jgi:hypothetical protein
MQMSSNSGITGPVHSHFWKSPAFSNFRFSFQIHLAQHCAVISHHCVQIRVFDWKRVVENFN